MLRKILFSLCLLLSFADSFAALRDPTMPPSWLLNANTPKDIELNGIYSQQEQNIASINGELVKEGSFIAGYTVIQIMPNFVALKNSNGSFVVPLVTNIKLDS